MTPSYTIGRAGAARTTGHTEGLLRIPTAYRTLRRNKTTFQQITKRIVVVVDAKIRGSVRHRVCRAGDLRPSQTRTNCTTRSAPIAHATAMAAKWGIRPDSPRGLSNVVVAPNVNTKAFLTFFLFQTPCARGQTRFFSQKGQEDVVFKVVD